MIIRENYLERLETAMRRSPIVSLLGPRQCGKTTLARAFGKTKDAVYFDLESLVDQRRLQNPQLALGSLSGMIILDEIQFMPSLFNVLRVLVDRPDNELSFLLLGSASPHIIKTVSETLAGRTEFIELSGFGLIETGTENQDRLWLRGGFPRSYLAETDEDSRVWRDDFIRTFLERDIPQLGITVPAAAMRRFWTMLAHFHGQVWNASELGRSLGLSDKTVRSYLDILTASFMIRQLQPWHENTKKRQVKSPRIYFRDIGLLHNLLGIDGMPDLLGNPRCGASWEGFALEQTLLTVRPSEAYFWSTHSGAEVDLFFIKNGKRYGVEFKLNEAPKVTKSNRVVIKDLGLDHLWIIYPGTENFPMESNITVWPISVPLELSRNIQ